MASWTQSGSCTSRSRISAHMVLRSAAVIACWSPLSTAASTACTSLAWPGKMTSGQDASFMAQFYARLPGEASGTRSQCRQKRADGRPEAGDVDQERVVSLRRWQRQEGGVRTSCAQAVGNLLLLLQREQDVGGDPDRQGLVDADLCKASRDVATIGRVFGQVEPVHRPAQVEVAVGIEAAHETARMAFEVTLDFEFEAERILVVATVGIQAHAAEAAIPFQRR